MATLDKEATKAFAKDPVAAIKSGKVPLIVCEADRQKIDAEIKKLSGYRSVSGKVNPPLLTSAPKGDTTSPDDVIQIVNDKNAFKAFVMGIGLSTEDPKLTTSNKRQLLFFPESAPEFKATPLVPVGVLPSRPYQMTSFQLPPKEKGLKVAFATPAPGNFAQLHRGSTGWMQSLYWSARQPAFYAHHGNVDRLWDDWIKKSSANAPTSAIALMENDGNWKLYWTNNSSKTETKLEPVPAAKDD